MAPSTTGPSAPPLLLRAYTPIRFILFCNFSYYTPDTYFYPPLSDFYYPLLSTLTLSGTYFHLQSKTRCFMRQLSCYSLDLITNNKSRPALAADVIFYLLPIPADHALPSPVRRASPTRVGHHAKPSYLRQPLPSAVSSLLLWDFSPRTGGNSATILEARIFGGNRTAEFPLHTRP